MGQLAREEILEKLLESYRRCYNIYLMEEEHYPLYARCDYFEHQEKFFLSRKANLWSADSEEFLYIYNVPELTVDLYKKIQEKTCGDGMERITVGPGHMASCLTAFVICDKADPEALKLLKKSRFHKSFHFSLHGWVDYCSLVFCVDDAVWQFNAAGRNAAKVMKKSTIFKKRRGETKQ